MTDREIDLLVAEKVMGWVRRGNQLLGPVYGDPTGAHSQPVFFLDTGTGEAGMPHYSTNIADAWTVVEKLRQEMCCLTVYSDHDFCWQVSLVRAATKEEVEIGMESHDPCAVVDGVDTAPMAICLAALKAVGVEISQ